MATTNRPGGSPQDSLSLEKRSSPTDNIPTTRVGDVEAAEPSGFQWFGGRNTAIGPRIAPVADSMQSETSSVEGGVSSDDILHKQLASEDGCAIQYRTCSWPKTAALLFSEYICLAIMSFPWAYSVLGLVPGLILTIFIAAAVLYTSLVLWQFCLRHPEVRDICDIGQMLFWGQRWAWYATAVMFILNNTFIQGLHVLIGAEYLNTMVTHGAPRCSTVVFSVIMAIISWLSSLPRTFDLLSKFAVASALFTFIAVILATIFAGIEDHPAGYDAAASGEPIVTAVPVAGTTFVAGMNAFLSISYTFIGQITLPSFIAEMRNPRDFPKALWACTVGEIIVFSVVGAVIYSNVGNQYMTAPAFGSLSNEVYKKVSFSFMIPTLIFLGVLYAAVSSRFIFFRVFENNKRHVNEHTLVGWASWAGILLATWVAAFIIAEVIPIFTSLLSLMSSLFDSFFGFIFWGVAFFRMRSVDRAAGYGRPSKLGDAASVALNLFIILVGVVFLTVGTYASVEGILDEFRAGAKGVFSCASNGL
ncbi:hypothetical protein ACHAQA_008465 [Verticillium albo-atrum]